MYFYSYQRILIDDFQSNNVQKNTLNINIFLQKTSRASIVLKPQSKQSEFFSQMQISKKFVIGMIEYKLKVSFWIP